MSPTDGPSRDEVRAAVHSIWGAVAGGWAEHADLVDQHGRGIAARLLDLADPQPGERVLELACGPGGLGFAAAERVGDGGEVVISDVASEMTAIARERAAAAGLGNVAFCELDLEDIAQADASFDAVVCRQGLMFASDPAAAAREIRRVLRPGGRAAVAVWGARERNPWLGVLLDAVSAETGHPVPPPGLPGPFSLAGDDELAEALEAGGLDAVTVIETDVPWGGGGFEQWWRTVPTLAGPVESLLQVLPAPTRDSIRARAEEAFVALSVDDGAQVGGLALVGSGRAPQA